MLKKQNRDTTSPNISITSDSVVSCCIKDLSLQIKNKDEEIENSQTTKKRSNSPTKINISIDNDSNVENINQVNNSSSRINENSSDDQRIYFSILLPKEFRESKNCKIQLSMDMNICLDAPNQKLPVNKGSNVQSKNSLTSASYNSISSSKSTSKTGLNRKNKLKKSIIDNLNTNEPNASKRSTGNLSSSNNNISSRKTSNVSSKNSSKVQSNTSLDSTKKNSLEKVNKDLNSYNKDEDIFISQDEDLMRIRQLKNEIDQVIEEGEQRRKSTDSFKNSIVFNSTPSIPSIPSSSVNASQRLCGSKDSVNRKPPLASSSKSSSVKNLQSKNNSNFDVTNTEDSLNENENKIQNLYLPQDSNRMKSKEDLAVEIEQFKENDKFGMYSPMDDREYNYLFDLIDNEYSVDNDVEPINVLGSDHSVNSSENDNNSKVIVSKDPSIIYNDDNEEKLERCYSSSFELTGVWKNFIVPYTTDSNNSSNKSKKDCGLRVYDDYTTEAKKKAYHHWLKIMLPEYGTFISRHSLQTVCAQNYILASLIEKMSFFKMPEEDPNPVVRESPQYNVERIDICLSYIKNVMDIPVAVNPYDLHLGKLASIFSLLTQLIRYYKRGLKMKSKIEKEEKGQLEKIEQKDIEKYQNEENEDHKNIKVLINEYKDNDQEDNNSISFSKELDLNLDQ